MAASRIKTREGSNAINHQVSIEKVVFSMLTFYAGSV